MPVAFVDTETLGLDAGRHPVWEIAIIRPDLGWDGGHSGFAGYKFFSQGEKDNGLEVVFQLDVDTELQDADPSALRIGDFWNRYHAGSKNFVRVKDRDGNPHWTVTEQLDNYEVARLVARLLDGCHLVGAVPNFDDLRLDKFLRKNMAAPAWYYHLIDVENLAVGYLAYSKATMGVSARRDGSYDKLHELLTPPWKSKDLYKELGVDPEDFEPAHTALADARCVRAVYDKIMGPGFNGGHVEESPSAVHEVPGATVPMPLPESAEPGSDADIPF